MNCYILRTHDHDLKWCSWNCTKSVDPNRWQTIFSGFSFITEWYFTFFYCCLCDLNPKVMLSKQCFRFQNSAHAKKIFIKRKFKKLLFWTWFSLCSCICSWTCSLFMVSDIVISRVNFIFSNNVISIRCSMSNFYLYVYMK